MWVNGCRYNTVSQYKIVTDITEDETKYELILDAYRVVKENVEIKYESGYLTVAYRYKTKDDSDETKETTEVENKKYILKERQDVDTSRSFYLPYGDISHATAKIEDGTLVIVLPKEKTRITDISVE